MVDLKKLAGARSIADLSGRHWWYIIVAAGPTRRHRPRKDDSDIIRSRYSFLAFALLLACLLSARLAPAAGPTPEAGPASIWEFETVDGRDDVGQSLSLALDSNGRPHLTYLQRPQATPPWSLQYAYWSGSDWTIETIDGNSGLSSLAIGPGDQPQVSFFQRGIGLAYAGRAAGAWSVELVDPGAGRGSLNSLALDSNGRPHIIYADYLTDDLRYAHWNGASWAIDLLLTSPSDIWALDFALDSLDRPHLVYRVFECQTLTCFSIVFYGYWDGNQWHHAPVDAADVPNDGGDISFSVSLALDRSDAPHLAFFALNDWSGHLVHARSNGSDFDATTFAHESSAGGGLDLAIDGSDRPHIVFSDGYWRAGPEGILKYARWTGSQWLFETVSGAGRIAADTVLALDGDRPLVAFKQLDTDDLLLARGTLAGPQIWLPVALR